MNYATLFFDWRYTMRGMHFSRNIDHPVQMSGSARVTVEYDGTVPLAQQIEKIRKQLKDFVFNKYRTQLRDDFYRWESEEIAEETVKISNIREATRWSDLEEF